MKFPDPPTTLAEFSRMFPSEKECSEYLFQIRWPNGFICPQCGSSGGYHLASRDHIECSNSHCRYQSSLTAGTILHRTKQSIHTWFWAAYLLTNLTPSISAKQFQGQLGLKRYETAFCMLHKLRTALVAPERDKLHGEIEVDEGYVGGKEEGRIGRGAEKKQLVVCAVELIRWNEKQTKASRIRCGRVRLQTIPDASGSTLEGFVKLNTARGSKVFTDGWSGYSFLEENGFQHEVRVQKRSDEPLKYVHRIISNFKTWLKGTYHGNMGEKHLQAYLNEYVFRFNRRFSQGKGFNRALGLAMELSGPTYEELYNAGEPGYWNHPVSKKKKRTKYL